MSWRSKETIYMRQAANAPLVTTTFHLCLIRLRTLSVTQLLVAMGQSICQDTFQIDVYLGLKIDDAKGKKVPSPSIPSIWVNFDGYEVILEIHIANMHCFEWKDFKNKFVLVKRNSGESSPGSNSNTRTPARCWGYWKSSPTNVGNRGHAPTITNHRRDTPTDWEHHIKFDHLIRFTLKKTTTQLSPRSSNSHSFSLFFQRKKKKVQDI